MSDEKAGWRSVCGMAAASVCSHSASIAALSFLSLAAAAISHHPSWATIPGALMLLTSGLLTFRISVAMQRNGRRRLFLIGAFSGMIGGGLCLLALYQQQFPLMLVGVVFLGVFLSTAGYYRFAAAENVDVGQVPRAISIVLAASLVAALAAPLVTNVAADVAGPVPFAAELSILMLAPLAALLPIALTPLRYGPAVKQGALQKQTPSVAVWRYPSIRLGLAASITGQMCMALMMQATPLAMQGCGFSKAQSAQVIQWHVIGMFGPALIAGEFVKQLGVKRTIWTGLFLFLLSTGIAFSSISKPAFFVSLFALGVAWNMLFTAGSTLLGSIEEPDLKARAQGLNETCVSLGSAATTASAAIVLAAFNWQTVVVLTTILLVPLFMFAIKNNGVQHAEAL
jgi:MFS family permease